MLNTVSILLALVAGLLGILLVLSVIPSSATVIGAAVVLLALALLVASPVVVGWQQRSP